MSRVENPKGFTTLVVEEQEERQGAGE